MSDTVYRSFGMSEMQVEERDGSPTKIVGYPVIYNKTSRDFGGFKEVIKPGSIRNLNTGDNIMALAHHDKTKPLGNTKAGTLTLRDTETGLYCEILPPDTSYGRDIITSVKRHDLDDMSFGFELDYEREWKTVNGEEIREIKSFTLTEVSVVTIGAFADTEVAVREFEKIKGERKDTQNSINKARLRLAGG